MALDEAFILELNLTKMYDARITKKILRQLTTLIQEPLSSKYEVKNSFS